MSANAVTLSGKAKAATPTAIESGTSGAGAAPVGGATAGAGAGAEEKAGTGSTEEAEVRRQLSSQPIRTGQVIHPGVRAAEAPLCFRDAPELLETTCCFLFEGDQRKLSLCHFLVQL